MWTHRLTQPHVHEPLPTSLTTHLCWLQSTQTHLLTRRAGRKEVNIWGVAATWSRGPDPPLTVGKLYRVFYNAALSLLSLSSPGGFTRHYVCWFVSVGRRSSLVFKRQVRPYSNTSHRHENCWFTLLQQFQTPTAVHVSLSTRTFSAIVSVRCWTETGQCWFLWFCLHEEWQELQLHVSIPDF